MYTKRHIFNSFLLLFLLSIRVNIFSQTAEDKEKGVNQWSTFTEENRTPCQILEAAWDTLNITPLQADTGSFLYIPLCLGDSVHFILYGIYPQNGQYYTQHDTLNIYTWDFGDGTQLTTQTPQAWHRYDSARGYEMNVYMTDTNNCISRPLIARILVTQNPVSAVNPIPQICVGDTTAIQPSSFVNFVPYSYSQISSQKFDSTMFIPDGPNCNPAHPCYNTDVIFTSFLPNQIITSASDILSVCVFMEHSYVGDLNFVIRCPNGQTDTLKKYIHWGGADMGIPGTPDSGCDPRNNPQGTPWNYCWSEIYPNIGTINANAGQARLDSTDRTNQLKYYLPDNNFSHLIGCPLNGIWSIEICDYWAVDNGYIFEWTLNLSPNRCRRPGDMLQISTLPGLMAHLLSVIPMEELLLLHKIQEYITILFILGMNLDAPGTPPFHSMFYPCRKLILDLIKVYVRELRLCFQRRLAMHPIYGTQVKPHLQLL